MGSLAAQGPYLHRNRVLTAGPNVQVIFAKGFTQFAFRTGPPKFLSKGVCLGVLCTEIVR